MAESAQQLKQSNGRTCVHKATASALPKKSNGVQLPRGNGVCHILSIGHYLAQSYFPWTKWV